MQTGGVYIQIIEKANGIQEPIFADNSEFADKRCDVEAIFDALSGRLICCHCP